MSNWDGYLEGVKKEGKLYSFFPIDYKLPMVAPADIGGFAANLMVAPVGENKLYHFEGPETYSPSDVAAAFSAALGRTVEPVGIPEEKWVESFKESGFSNEAAKSYAAMTRASLSEDLERPTAPVRGKTTIDRYVSELMR